MFDKFYGLFLVIEFRHRLWVCDCVFVELEYCWVMLVSVDELDLSSLFPALDVVINFDLFYVCFYGCNAKGWRFGKMQ